MKKWLLGAALAAITCGSAFAQGAGQLYWQCVAVDSGHPSGGWCPVGTTYPLPVQDAGSAGSAITPKVAGPSVSSLVVSTTANSGLASASVTTGSTQGWLYAINATSLPADGPITIGTAAGNAQLCVYAPASSTTSAAFFPGPLDKYSTGITLAFSSAACGTLTASATATFLRGSSE